MKALSFMTIFVALAFLGTSLVQMQEPTQTPKGRIDDTKPTVYFSFEKVELTTLLGLKQKERAVKLRLHNNSSWAIRFKEQGALYQQQWNDGGSYRSLRLGDGSQVSGFFSGKEYNLCYGRDVHSFEAFHKKSYPKPFYNEHSCRTNAWLASGESIVLTIRRDLLAKYTSIFVYYNYEWERDKTDPEESIIRNKEPQHRVLFYETDLPK